MIRPFSCRVCRNCCHVFLCYPTCLLISRNFHCDAIIPVVKLFWWVALEPTTNSKCKHGQSQWILLKLEQNHCSQGLLRLDTWTTQRSSAGGILGREWLQRRRMFHLRCHNFELIKPASWGYPRISLSAREVLGSLSGPVPVVSSVVKRTDYWCGRSGA